MIPKFKDYFYPFLLSISDGQVHTINEIRNSISRILHLTPESLTEKTKGGRCKHDDRVKWTITYLKRVELIIHTKKFNYKITDKGKQMLEIYGHDFSLDKIRDMEGYKELSRTKNPSKSHWVEGHYRHDGKYVAGYYSNYKAQGLRKTRVTLEK